MVVRRADFSGGVPVLPGKREKPGEGCDNSAGREYAQQLKDEQNRHKEGPHEYYPFTDAAHRKQGPPGASVAADGRRQTGLLVPPWASTLQ
jgi:hypothetical protein